MSKQPKQAVFRNPIYVFYIVGGIVLFILGALIANNGSGTVETSLFRSVNELPGWLTTIVRFISLFGTIGFAVLLSLYFLARRLYKAALKIFLAGAGAYVLAYGTKLLEIRPRPGAILENVQIREQAMATFGYPSGHVAVATALAIIMYQYMPSRLHKRITAVVWAVALSRLYLGVHLPMDLVGGFALGLVVGSVVSLLFGRIITARVSPAQVKKALIRTDFPVKTVEVLGVDARGSSPFMVTSKDGKKYFLKVVNKDNFVADWLFKAWRKIVYRRLEDESPFFTPKRQIEHESYVAGLAFQAGIKTPRIVDVLEVKADNWAQIQEAIDGKSLDKVDPKRVTDTVLNKTFALVAQLHKAHIVHRDLRAANIFLDNKNEPWLIDFGFSEASVGKDQTYRDLVEMIASFGVIVGAERVVAAAVKNIPKEEIENALRFMTYPSMSSETTRLLKQKQVLLQEIVKELKQSLKIKELNFVQMTRVNLRTVIIVVGFALFLYFAVTQQEDFKNSLTALGDAKLPLLLVAIMFSALSYFAAAMVYKLIAIYALPYWRTLLVQVASSFTNRLLPAGTGGLATFTRYLVTEGHTKPQAAALATVNNIFGFVAITSLTILTAALSKTSLREAIKVPLSGTMAIVIAVLVVAAIITVYLVKPARAFTKKMSKHVKADFKLIAANPTNLALALLSSMVITICYAAVLYFSIQALGANATILQTFIVLTVGVAAASVTPTPGGIGGAEAGLVAGLTSIGLSADISLSIAMVYRFATFWLPIIPGFIAFHFALKKKIL